MILKSLKTMTPFNARLSGFYSISFQIWQIYSHFCLFCFKFRAVKIAVIQYSHVKIEASSVLSRVCLTTVFGTFVDSQNAEVQSNVE